ncbi:antitermination protein [Escherichia coli]|uniref:antitermination protein Q n=1 Tax=Escherichia coli TaxID=562 RepID=UPI00207867EC|nr:antitermination protein [Escherichia coli]
MMNLESILKFHFPKSPRLSDESRGTSPDALNTTDALTAAGMAQSRVELGYSAFLGKMELSQAEKHRAVVLLTERLMAMAKDYEYVMELNEDQRNGLIILVAVFAFRDYCQSAATEKVCPKCGGNGLLPNPYCEYTSTVCSRCNGKGYVKNHCQRCKGRGEVPDKAASEAAEMPVFKTCQHCGGRGYSRFPVDLVRQAVNQLVFPVSRSTWWKKYRVFYEDAIAELFKEEARAESEIKRVTRGE